MTDQTKQPQQSGHTDKPGQQSQNPGQGGQQGDQKPGQQTQKPGQGGQQGNQKPGQNR
jgi:hypothetical protein